MGPVARVVLLRPQRLVRGGEGSVGRRSQGGRLPCVQLCPAAWRSWPGPKGSTQSFTTTAGEGQRRGGRAGGAVPCLPRRGVAQGGARCQMAGSSASPTAGGGGRTPVVRTAPAGWAARGGARHHGARRWQLQDIPVDVQHATPSSLVTYDAPARQTRSFQLVFSARVHAHVGRTEPGPRAGERAFGSLCLRCCRV